MEHTIGNLGQEIRQPSNPYANISQEGARCCKVNALLAVVPELDPPPPQISSTLIDLGQAYIHVWRHGQSADNVPLGDGYILMRMHEKSATLPTGADATALTTFLNARGHGLVPIQRWARLWLPNGQTAWTAWREAPRENGADIRISRNVKVSPPSPAWNMHLSTQHQVNFAGTVRFAEVQYYTRLAVEQSNLEIADEDNDAHWKFLDVAVI